MMKNKDKENKIKIALISYSLSSGGLERVIANSSIMFNEMNIEVDLHILEAEIHYPFAGTIFVYDIKNKSILEKIRKYELLRKNLKNNNYNLIIDHRYRLSPSSEFFWQYYIYSKQKVVNYIHSSVLLYYFSSLNSKLVNLIFRKRLFLSVSKGIESKVKTNFPSQKIKTIYNPISFSKPEIKPEIQKYIVTISRMDFGNTKQVDVLLECFAKSKLPENDYKLIIIGSGEKQTEMELLAKQLNVSNQVIFKGFLENPYHYLKNAFFTTLTSKYEGLPTVLIESLMLGTPVVSYDCETGPNEIIINEENGLLIDNQNKIAFIEAMNRMISEPELYQKLKSNAVKSVEKFSIHQINYEWEKFLNNEIVSDKY